jgi:hypothetical protein
MRPRLALVLLLLVTILAGAMTALPGAPLVIHGRVLGPEGALAAARVRVQGTDAADLTTASGSYRLPLVPGRRLTAGKEGFLIAGTAAGPSPRTFRLLPLPTDDNFEYSWVDPAPKTGDAHACGNCHADIYREWASSGHAHSATGRHFRNLYEGTDWDGTPGVGWGLVNQHPDGAGVCAACHAPAIPPQDDAFLDLRDLRGTARQGVHCDFCHKIAGPAEGTIGLTHGRYGLRLLRPVAGRQLFFGPLDDVDRGEDAYSAFYHDSRYCASCHEGTVFGVPVYTTWSEWLESPARRQGKQCQDCHMRPTGNMTNIASGHGGIERPPHTLASHRFFDGSRADMLRRSLHLSAHFQPQTSGVRVRLDLTAEEVGHRVPTGFIDRQLILVVEGTDGDGKPLGAQEGPRLPAPVGEALAGKPGRLYARLLRDAGGHAPVPFWSPAPAVTDTRLTPERADVIDFRFPPGVRQIRARLVYRRFWDEVTRAKGWPDRDLIVVERTFAVPPG